jgi:hypothetical protein
MDALRHRHGVVASHLARHPSPEQLDARIEAELAELIDEARDRRPAPN